MAENVVATPNATSFESEPLKSRVIIQGWESMEQLHDWYRSSEHTEAHDIVAKYVKIRTLAVEVFRRDRKCQQAPILSSTTRSPLPRQVGVRKSRERADARSSMLFTFA
ncbi:DUF1330 domain-containing protein [Bradyrhizobium manausense]|uniref:DUF1330 domain-containing protein n=1 Tax=Bradyrhizobium manausense TaxID=989370 RepID=UPI001BAA2863|nr:DUF1330 domain-containing protein [Bradyrhizobium manausense]